MLFLLTFFPKNIIRLQFCALASCLPSCLCLFRLAVEQLSHSLASLSTMPVCLPTASLWAGGL